MKHCMTLPSASRERDIRMAKKRSCSCRALGDGLNSSTQTTAIPKPGIVAMSDICCPCWTCSMLQLVVYFGSSLSLLEGAPNCHRGDLETNLSTRTPAGRHNITSSCLTHPKTWSPNLFAVTRLRRQACQAAGIGGKGHYEILRRSHSTRSHELGQFEPPHETS